MLALKRIHKVRGQGAKPGGEVLVTAVERAVGKHVRGPNAEFVGHTPHRSPERLELVVAPRHGRVPSVKPAHMRPVNCRVNLTTSSPESFLEPLTFSRTRSL